MNHRHGRLTFVRGFDVIGDVHGFADKLEGLLQELGYEERDGAYRYAGSGEDARPSSSAISSTAVPSRSRPSRSSAPWSTPAAHRR